MITSTTPIGLAVTSSTGVISVAVGATGSRDPLASATLETDRRHAEEISPLIRRLVTEAGLTLSQIQVLVVDRGPGRFTGLRVGLATVKTLAFALDIPVVGITSLEVLANTPAVIEHDQFSEGSTVTAVIDARRNEVFQQVFKAGRALADPVVGPADKLGAEADGIVIGDGLDRYPEPYGNDNVISVFGVNVDAVTMLDLAGAAVSMAGSEIEPLYLRNPDVNPNVKTRPRV